MYVIDFQFKLSHGAGFAKNGFFIQFSKSRFFCLKFAKNINPITVIMLT